MKTRVDDMLLEMISPKIKEIEEKFSKGGALTQDDINTLLLKSQYNHINHLDIKLDETVEVVKNLEKRFEILEEKYEKLEQKFDATVKELRGDYEKLEQKFDTTIKELKGDYARLEQKFDATIKELKRDYARLEQKIDSTIK